MRETFETSVHIAAAPDDVFDHFVKPELLVGWMGEYARLDASAGGVFSVDISGVLIRGHYVTVERPTLIEIAWGEAGNDVMPPGATHLRVELEAAADGTRLTLIHSGLVPGEAEKHGGGWPVFLERLAVRAAGGDPGPYPWAAAPSAAAGADD